MRLQTLNPEQIVILAQVRKTFDQAAHMELVESIKKHGILQPLLVRANAEGNSFTLIAGERRLRAAKELKLEEVPVGVVFGHDEHHTEMQVVENIQRENLSLEETAGAVDALYKRYGKMSEVAGLLGKSMPWVSKMVAVANKLGKLATELLAGGFTQDVELLTTLSRAEALGNAFPRVEILAGEIAQKKAGRAEVIALYEELKRELDESVEEEGEGEGAGDGEPEGLNFTAVDKIHEQLKANFQLEFTAGRVAGAADLVATTVRAYHAHFLALLPKTPEPTPTPVTPIAKGRKQK